MLAFYAKISSKSYLFYLLPFQDRRKVWKSGDGGSSNEVGVIYSPLVEIVLTDLPKSVSGAHQLELFL